MKKILIILAILTIGVFGQNTDKSTKLLTQQEITNRLFENTIEATRVKVVNTSSPIEKDESDFTDGTESFATATDTLSWSNVTGYDTASAIGDTVSLTIGQTYYYKKGSSDSASFNGITKIILTGADTTFIANATQFYVKGDLTNSAIIRYLTFNFGNQYKTCAIVVRDTTGGSALVDSLVIETYIPMLDAWTYYITMYKQGEIFQGDEIVPGNNKIVRYTFVDPYIGQIRIRWYYGANKVNRKVPLVFEGSN